MNTSLGQRISTARKTKGWTQEELAERTNLTIRTIQRLENNENTPRLHTLRTIADALDISLASSYPTLAEPSHSILPGLPDSQTHERSFLHRLNLTSFTYLFVPLAHVLLLYWLLKRKPLQHRPYQTFGWQILKTQIWWIAATNGLMLLTLFYNLLQAVYRPQPVFISYFLPFGGMYLLNGWLIFRLERKLKSVPFAP